MSTLIRMKREIGFRQLLCRLESCPSDERDRFLASIAAEDPGRAALLKTKSLTLDRVLSWDPVLLAPLFSGLPPRTIACLFALAPQQMDHATHGLATNFLRNVRVLERSAPITIGEKEAARIHLFTHIREQERLGLFQLTEIDPVVAAPAEAASSAA